MAADPKTTDIDAIETREWIDSLRSVIDRDGIERAHFLLTSLMQHARESGASLPFSVNTPYVNTIPESRSEHTPGDPAIEWRIRSLIRWNALAMVVQANRLSSELGGHIASFASAATLYDVGFNHFWHAPNETHGGDLIFMQGHSAPGIYARAFLEGRIGEDQLNRFRQEVDGEGLSSYPHPWLMPDFWQFPTVSMGLGPIMAIYQARFMKYLHNRGLLDTSRRKVWAFMGDGEMDEPEALGAITLASREKLDNLVFVVNCNLQRLDGPVRGNGKIIQELEAAFRGAGWNVLKVIWGSYWDPLLRLDTRGLLRKRMEEAVDGEYQNFKAKGGAYTREHFFGKYPELKKMVSNLSDEDIWRLNRGGHDPHKVYAAYAEAVRHAGAPTVILAKTVKGYGMGEAGEGQNITHQQKKMGEDALKAFRDRFNIPISDDEIADAPFYRPPEDSPEIRYMRERRERLGGYLPQRRRKATPLAIPDLSAFDALLKGSGEREISTTMAFVRILTTLTRDKQRRPLRGADRPRREPAPSAWRGCSASSASTPTSRPALRAAGRGPAHVLPRGARRADPRGGHQRGRRDQLLDCRRHRLFQPRDQHDPLLHLLLDVRVPAHRRSGMGGRGHAGARLPGRRHRGTHDPCRRGAPARRRAQPHPRVHHSELRLLRPHLRVRARGHRAPRAEADVLRAGKRLLLPHRDERELPAPADAGRLRGRHPPGDVPAAQGVRRRKARRRSAHGFSFLAAAPSCARWSRRRSCWMRTSRWTPTCGAPPASRSCAATAWRRSGGTDCTRPGRRAGATSSSAWNRTPVRWWRHPTTCACSRIRSAPGCAGPMSPSAPTASDAATCAPGCGGSSRSTGTTSRSPP